MNVTEYVDHRPWPLPANPSIIAQSWHNLLFAHWPVAPSALLPVVPAGLELDTFEGQAWVGVVPFTISGFRSRLLAPVPLFSSFAELNVRTYVVAGGKPGVFFYSLDAANPLAVAAARAWFHLPYFNAQMSVKIVEDQVGYASRRTHRHAPVGEFAGTYRPTAAVRLTQRGSLESWLTERYCLYAVDRRQRIYRGDIHHRQWPLQAAEAELITNTVALSHGIQLPDIPPLLHYSHRLDVIVWPPQRL